MSPLVSVLNCKLPVLSDAGAAAGYVSRGGFVTFPQASYAVDPDGVLTPVGDGEVDTMAKPVLRAYGGPGFYDLAVKRWIPATPAETSPDGRTYANAIPPFGGPSSTVVVVTVATGAQRDFQFNDPTVALVEDFDGRYAYVSEDRYPVIHGVWRLDTATGSVAQLSQEESVLALRAPDLWIGKVNSSDPSPPRSTQDAPLYDSLVHVDLGTGAQTVWSYRPGEAVFLQGFDVNGHPVVSVASGPDFNASTSSWFVLDGPGEGGTQISDGKVPLSRMQSDVGRIWFGSDRGIYVWTQAGGLQRAFAFDKAIIAAGRCV